MASQPNFSVDDFDDNNRLVARHPMLYVWGMSPWKKPIVKRFFPGHKLRFIRKLSAVKAGASLLVWGSQPLPAGLAPNVAIIRLEDGFLRSIGLGAALTRPLSWAVDTRGIYYNATGPSDLEYILQHLGFSEQLLQRAEIFHQRLIEHGVTKYNLQGQAWSPPQNGKRIILVPGQVETDASIAFGAGGAVKTNFDLVKAVRANHPDAWVIYKPHPDVVAGLRAKGINEDQIRRHCDEYIEHVAIEQLLKQADEVHVMTSLSGFEALLRGKAVTCYGLPFYAGWGLTTDMISTSRRTRQLSLQALIAGALLIYPMYISWDKGKRVSPEEALDELIANKGLGKKGKMRALKQACLQYLIKLVTKER